MIDRARSEEGGGGRSGVDEDVVFLKFLDVSLNLVHLGLNNFLAGLLSDGVQLAVVGLLLVVAHKNLPLLLKSSDELEALFLRHEHALAITLVLLFDLHLTDEVVLVSDFSLDVVQVLRGLSIDLLLEEVLVLAGGKLGGYKI